jgi:hypothetical protein
MIRGILTLAVGLINVTAWAQDTTPTAASKNDGPHYSSYYVIDEPSAFTAQDVDPRAYLLDALHGAIKTTVSLMQWTVDHANWPDPTEPYNRRRHFGTWLPGASTPRCVNTRGQVLERDSAQQVEMNPSGCTVKSGLWHDPYTGTDITEASKVQVDHVVPLKNAYLSGAWKWDRRTRCAYANFMANGFHLLTVSGHENMSKGDGTPAEWMPPNTEFTCTYLRDWLEIKLIWGLIMNPDESAAIKTLFAKNGCDPQGFKMDEATLARQRAAIQQSLDECPKDLVQDEAPTI